MTTRVPVSRGDDRVEFTTLTKSMFEWKNHGSLCRINVIVNVQTRGSRLYFEHGQGIN